MKKTQDVLLTPAIGDILVFSNFNEEKMEKHMDDVSPLTFTTKDTKELHSAQNVRIILDNGKEHLKEIVKNSKFKKYFKDTLTNAKEALGFTPSPTLTNEPTLTNTAKPKNTSPKPSLKNKPF